MLRAHDILRANLADNRSLDTLGRQIGASARTLRAASTTTYSVCSQEPNNSDGYLALVPLSEPSCPYLWTTRPFGHFLERGT